MLNRTTIGAALAFAMASTVPAMAQDIGEVKVFHRWADDASRQPIEAMFAVCEAALPGLTITSSYVPADQYEVQLPVQLSAENPPDIYGLWPGGRAVFQAQAGNILDISDLWESDISQFMPRGMTEGVMETDGKIYVVPFNTLPNAFWYNKKVFEEHGLVEPKTWDEFLVVLDTLKKAGIDPIALGSRRGWEPLFWFDYLILRTAGSQFREDLMWGKESYLDPRVTKAMEMWKGLLEKGYFNDNITSYSDTDMATAVISGRAGMELMGPWTLANFEQAGLVAGVDYDFFPFPVIDPTINASTEGAFEGFAATGKGPNTEGAKKLLACLAGTDAQTAYASGSYRIAANDKVSPDLYKESARPILIRLAALLSSTFHQNMELATLPPVVETAKREFPRFLTFPDQYMDLLQKLEDRANEVFE